MDAFTILGAIIGLTAAILAIAAFFTQRHYRRPPQPEFRYTVGYQSDDWPSILVKRLKSEGHTDEDLDLEFIAFSIEGAMSKPRRFRGHLVFLPINLVNLGDVPIRDVCVQMVFPSCYAVDESLIKSPVSRSSKVFSADGISSCSTSDAGEKKGLHRSVQKLQGIGTINIELPILRPDERVVYFEPILLPETDFHSAAHLGGRFSGYRNIGERFSSDGSILDHFLCKVQFLSADHRKQSKVVTVLSTQWCSWSKEEYSKIIEKIGKMYWMGGFPPPGRYYDDVMMLPFCAKPACLGERTDG